MANFKYETKDGIALVTFDTPDSKVNILSAEALGELDVLLKRAAADRPKALILRSAKKKIFIAGADIKEIESISEAEEGAAKARAGQDIFNTLEDLPFPTVVLINGTTLGGGLELSLAADYRIATYDESAQIGLPETKLGIIPGFGGTWRLPRRTGLQKGLEWITQGKTGNPFQARSAGIVDLLTHEDHLMETALEFLEKKCWKKAGLPQRKRKGVEPLLEDTPFGRAIVRKEAAKAVLKATKGQYPAPLKAVDVVVDNFKSDRKSAMEREAIEFGKIAAAGTHKPLIRVFYLMERFKKEKWVDAKGVLPEKTAVIGAGVMGGGIAQLVSSAGFPIRMKDIHSDALLLGLRSARQVYVEAVKRRKLTRYVAEASMGRILPTLDYSGFKRCGIVIEAVVESLDIKKKVFAELSKVCAPDAILASNTSSLSVSRMADQVENPDRVVGMHFFNPVHRMPLVEIIRAEKTSDATIATIVDFSRKLRKTPIVVKDAPGFLVNRLLLPFLNEAGFIFEEGESPETIDRHLLNFGMPMGAFRLLDEIGMDVAVKVSHILHEAFGERMKPCASIDQMVQKKWLGKKSGKGFYIYPEKTGKKDFCLNPELANPSERTPHSAEDIVDRCVFAMINEAARCLEEKIVREPADVDIGMIMGTGFPPFRAGLLRHADAVGSRRIVERLAEFGEQTGSTRFKPAPLLAEMAKTDARFFAA